MQMMGKLMKERAREKGKGKGKLKATKMLEV
jgi:hypothetical protein